jgi:hypothetical protein
MASILSYPARFHREVQAEEDQETSADREGGQRLAEPDATEQGPDQWLQV